MNQSVESASKTAMKSDRVFKVWEYQISHGQLLIRSPKAPAKGDHSQQITNLDLVFLGVEFMAVPHEFRGVDITLPAAREVEELESLLNKSIEPKSIRIIDSQEKRFPIVASSFSFSENDWDIFESPFEFRSRFRGS